MKILLVEDDSILADLITRHLTAKHYVVDVVSDGVAGLSYGSTFDYDLLILDLQLPQLDGVCLCQQFRAEGDETPILVLTAEQSNQRKIQALDAGADDYMVKPFDMGELEARMRALLRRGQGQSSPMLLWGELLMNPMSGEVTYGDRPLKLTSTEYKLLELLITNGIHVVSLEEIQERIWSSDEFPAESTVRSHVRRLRKKLQKAGAPTDFVSTLHGRGYYLKPSQGAEGEILAEANGEASGESRRNSYGKSVEESTNLSQSNSPLARAASEPPNEASGQSSGQSSGNSSGNLSGNSSGGLSNNSLAKPSAEASSAPAQALTQTAIQMQYLQFLNETWSTAQQSCLKEIERLKTLPPQQQAAIAHRLAGTLGMFGLSQIVQVIRQLEGLYREQETVQARTNRDGASLNGGNRDSGQNAEIQNADIQNADIQNADIQSANIEQKRQQVWQWVQNTTRITALPQFPEQPLPTVWILSEATGLNQDLAAAADSQCLQSRVFENWPLLWSALQQGPLPHQMIARLQHLRPLLSRPRELKQFKARMAHIPLLILGEQDRLSDRLQALRLGGTFLLRSQVSAEQMVTASLIAAHQQSSPMKPGVMNSRSENLKVMLVDDDPHLLKHLFQQLSPLGFKVTTLAEPKHFWNVLQAVKPDALILDIKIPGIDGFELCQLVRHDPRWKRLPILFLSILNDPETRQRAFSAGADDYLFKPVFAPELAHRIVSRLDRIKVLSP